MDTFPIAAPWPPFQSLSRVTLAIALGLFVGLEREWRGKEAGLRTFAFVALLAALRYGALFVVLEISSEAAQRFLGQAGFYTVTALGGLVSSASAVASAATLAAQGRIPVAVAAIGAVIASLASAAINIVIVARVSRQRGLSLRLAAAMVFIVALGVLGSALL